MKNKSKLSGQDPVQSENDMAMTMGKGILVTHMTEAQIEDI